MIDMTYFIVFVDEEFDEKYGNLSILSLHQTVHDDYDGLFSIILFFFFLEIVELYLKVGHHGLEEDGGICA